MDMESGLAARLAAIRENLAKASEGRYPVPKLIAVTKTHPAEDILPLKKLGITDIGENRVQELEEKLPALERNFHIHLIGRLQSNKVKYIIEDVCLIHSLDRLSLAQEIDRQAQKAGRVMPVLVQVSPAGEEQKGGMPPEEVLPFLRTVRGMPGLQVRGLMAVMPLSQDEAYLSGLFSGMRQLFERLREELRATARRWCALAVRCWARGSIGNKLRGKTNVFCGFDAGIAG